MICPDRVRMFVRESLCRTLLRIRDPKLVLPEGNFKKGSGQWGRSIGPGPRAHMGLGISVPYKVHYQFFVVFPPIFLKFFVI